MTPPLLRPHPLPVRSARPVDHGTPPARAAAWLRDGRKLRVADRYDTGARILAELHTLLEPPPEGATHPQRRAFRATWRQCAHRLLVSVEGHRLALADPPEIPFLRELYPELSSFALPFAEVQGINRAWHRYRDGVHTPVLGHRLHPFYGAYLPERMTHIELFATWLSGYAGPQERAVDVGCGCGVLALLLGRAGFERVVATDSSPNAIESVTRELRRLDPSPQVEPRCCDLLDAVEQPADLIVFNPPWTQGVVEEPLDAALYFEEGLFERFFAAARARLVPTGRVVVVFSNLIELVQPELPHPIRAELERGRFELVQQLHRRVRHTPSRDGAPRRRTRERVEVWELAPR